MEVIESTFNKMAPKVHLICSILPKESKFCITLKHSFRAGIYELSYVVFCQRLAFPPGTMWDLSGLVAWFFLPMATEEQDRPGQCGPSGSILALTYGWSWSRRALPMHGDGDGVVVSPPWPGSRRSLHAVQQRGIMPQPTVSSPPSQL